MRHLLLPATAALLAASTASAATMGSRFDPNDFASNGVLVVGATDTIVFDTSALTYTINADPAVAGGISASSESGNVELAMFNFDSISFAAGSTVTVTGNRGLALGSLASITLATSIDVGGANGDGDVGGLGGSGAEGGTPGSFDSDPPGSSRGKGGNDASATANSGRGFGAGIGGIDFVAGSGGSYGGVGNGFDEGTTDLRGATYGDAMLTDLYGGSGGAGGIRTSFDDASSGAGGGGGGAVTLTALDTISLIAGSILVDGGNGGPGEGSGADRGGGGGSGGGILLNAPIVSLDATSLLDAGGGAGANDSTDGGNGGGGRIAIYADSLTNLGTVDVALNAADRGGSGGTDGTFYTAVFIPEPASLALLGLGGLCMLTRRRA